MKLPRWLADCLAIWLLCPIALALADGGDCAPHILSMAVAPASTNAQTPPSAGWQPVTLPDHWRTRWPAGQSAAWYRVDWQPNASTVCTAEPLALSIQSISMAGAVYLNDDLLWRDAALAEPMSQSWNMPRWWALPAAALRPGVNTVWVRVVSPPELSGGLGHLLIDTAVHIEAAHDRSRWRQRTALILTAGLSGAVGGVFLVVWYLRRQERAFGWYALMSLCWMLYLVTLLTTKPWPLWPFASAVGMSRLNLIALLGYVLCFCMFTFRFGGQRLPRTERVLLTLAALGSLAMLLAPGPALFATSLTVLGGSALVFFGNCLQFQWHAWRPRPGGCDRVHQGLALCWLLFLAVGLHDLLVVLNVLDREQHGTWLPVTGPIATFLMALLLGSRLTQGMQRIEHFNQELADSVTNARAELAQALAREHARQLENARLHAMQHERTQLAHDLHDGLGASLVRGMALAEQATRSQLPLPGERVLALFKELRDDLRQVIDYGSSATASAPASPELWIAPLRHRFIRILDELNVVSEWRFAAAWHVGGPPPSMLQCLGLARILEEALSNVIKHSHARRVCVECDIATPSLLRLRVEDDGQGFDTAAARHLSVGLRSMAARAARIGGTLSVDSRPGHTTVCVEVPLAAGG